MNASGLNWLVRRGRKRSRGVSTSDQRHGNGHRARQQAGYLRDDTKGLEPDYPHLGKFARSAQKFAAYITSNAGSLINYGERFQSGERISSGMAESTVNAVVSKCFAKRQ